MLYVQFISLEGMVSFGMNEIVTSYNADFTLLRATSEPVECCVAFYAAFCRGV